MIYVVRSTTLVRSLVLFFTSASLLAAEPKISEQAVENDSPQQLVLLKDKMVILEGVLWGQGWPGLGRRVVLASGQRIYFEGKDGGEGVSAGQLVRVHGRLSLKHWNASERGKVGYSKGFDYWIIKDPVFKVIERIKTDNILEYTSKINK